MKTGQRAMRALLAAALLLGPAAFAAGLFDEAFQITSKVEPAEVPAGGTFDLTVSFKLGLGVHLYKDKLSFTWDDLKGAKQVEIVLPKGTLIDDLNTVEPGDTTEAYEGSVDAVVRFRATGKPGDAIVVRGQVGYQGCTDEICFREAKAPIAHQLRIAGGGAPATRAPAGPTTAAVATPATDAAAQPGPPPGAPALTASAFLWRVLVAFGAGVLISFTPCVYPMIPITVAIVGGGKDRGRGRAVARSALYVLGIAITYSVMGVLVAAVGGTVRIALQSPYVLVPIAGLFVVLALGMFDVITIQTPGSVGGLAERLSGKTAGVVGILLLGMASGLVAGPCVAAPLAGVLISIAESGSKLLGLWSMFALAWGMGLILIVAGASTSLLPRAGPWMDWVKKLLGFVLLWAAVYFLRSVVGERLYHLGTAGVLLAGAVFLGCLDSLSPSSGFGERAKRVLGLVAILAAAGTVFTCLTERREMAAFAAGDPEAVEAALAAGKPLVLDFYADGCAPCEEMDLKTFSDPRVVQELQRFRTLKVNTGKPENQALNQRFDIFGAPTIVLFDSKGAWRKDLSFAGFKGPDEFLAILRRIQ